MRFAREELGIDPKDLGGSAWEAAVASFVLFALGAIVPILPFLVVRGTLAVASSAVVSALALFGLRRRHHGLHGGLRVAGGGPPAPARIGGGRLDVRRRPADRARARR